MNKAWVKSRPGEGMAVARAAYFGESFHGQLWVKVKARKAGKCDGTGESYKPGAEVYRPTTNTRNRSQRLLATFVEA